MRRLVIGTATAAMLAAGLAVGATAHPPAAHAPAPAPSLLTLMPGIYTDEEDVYFAGEAKKTPPPYTALQITREGDGLRLRTIDKFGKPTEDGHLMTVTGTTLSAGPCTMPFRVEGSALVALPRTGKCHNEAVMARVAPAGVTLTWADGTSTLLRRARTATCWGALLRKTPKPDGSEDWQGTFGLKLHDQGGRVRFGGGDSGTPETILRMRNVVWPSGPNKPSLVLYIHTPDQPDHAVSYSWADPEAKRIGINLRWMQASCTIDQPDTTQFDNKQGGGHS